MGCFKITFGVVSFLFFLDNLSVIPKTIEEFFWDIIWCCLLGTWECLGMS
jgi:hypothetical protein